MGIITLITKPNIPIVQRCTYKQLNASHYALSSVAHISSLTTVPLSFDLIDKHSKNNLAKPHSPVVILHGLFCSKVSNQTLSKLLNEKLKRDIYLLDLRNHGESPHVKLHDYPSMAADVYEWAKKHLNQSPIIVGHSMGAKVAMTLALHQPEMCKSLICLENAPINTSRISNFITYISVLQEIVAKKQCSRDEALATILKVESNLTIANFLLKILKRDGKNYICKIPLNILKDSIAKGLIAGWPFPPGSCSYNGPTLFIRGTKSNFISDDCIPEIARFFPNFRIRDVNAGHWINSEAAHECTEYIHDFLTRQDN